ncbi:bifunctional solanapyrone synthase [Aspergillus germanicus]
MRLLFLTLFLAAAAHARPTIFVVDRFLESIDVNPTSISTADKAAGSIAFTCSVLTHYPSNNNSNTSSQYLITQSHPSYLTQAHAHWSTTAYRHPACIYSPPTPDQVAIAVRIATFSSTPFAIRSGGHSPLSGWANIDDQLLISLSGIRDLHYDETTQTVRVGFGNRWQDVYDFLAPYNRLVVGGRQGTVGMALTVGGGLSHLSNEHGWPAQNVLSYTVVLADGRIVTASATEHAELYFAIKAGGNNFGVVTHITMRTVPAGAVWGGQIVYSANNSREFMAALAEYQRGGQMDVKSAVLPYVGLNNDTIICTLAYLNGNVDSQLPEAFRPFYDIPAMQDSTGVHASFADLAALELPSVVPRWTYATTTLLLDTQAYVDILDLVAEYSDAISRLQGGSFVIMPQPISRSMVKASVALADDPMNVTPAAQLWLTLNVGWSLSSDDEAVHTIITAAMARIEEYTKSRGVYDPFLFLNDAHSSQEPFAGYGEVSYARLRAASQRYDPARVFLALVVGGFKLEAGYKK